MNNRSIAPTFWDRFWRLANPKVFMGWSGRLLPWIAAAAALSLCSGLIWGYFLTPDDMRQGSTVKIIYLHVPAALMAINGYLLMFVGALVWLIRRQHVSVLAAKAAAPVGMVMTLIALATGAIWGQPMWGTYWVWDPRLTSFLILFLFYVGYIALWAAIEDEDTAADLTSVLAIVGAVFAMLSRYAVLFWNQGLHQGTTVTMADGAKQENISNVFFQPLLLSMAGFGLLFLTLLLVGTHGGAVASAEGIASTGADGMMPDLGKYALEVNSSYALSLLALAVITGLYVRRSRAVKRALAAQEAAQDA